METSLQSEELENTVQGATMNYYNAKIASPLLSIKTDLLTMDLRYNLTSRGSSEYSHYETYLYMCYK